MRKPLPLPVLTYPLPVLTKEDCKGCGACCRHMGRTPPFKRGMHPEPAWRKLPQHLKDRIIAITRKYGPWRPQGKPCIWLQADGTCKHHQYRPKVCSDFETGSVWCHGHRQRLGVVKEEALEEPEEQVEKHPDMFFN